jgi:hypothetical protein
MSLGNRLAVDVGQQLSPLRRCGCAASDLLLSLDKPELLAACHGEGRLNNGLAIEPGMNRFGRL